MFANTIPSSARFTCFLTIVAAITVLLSITTKAAPLQDQEDVFTYPPPPLLFDDAPATIKRLQPHIDPSAPLFRCYCNLPECLTATGGMPVCHTRQGCFFRIKTTVTELTEPSQLAADPMTTTTTTTVQTIPEEFDERLIMSNTDHIINGAYGCLDLLPSNQTCKEMQKVTEDSEFPDLPSTKSSETLHAYHCCQNDMCNDRINPVTDPNFQAAREALKKAFQSSTVTHRRKITPSDVKTVTAVADLAGKWLDPFNSTNGKKTVKDKPVAVAAEDSAGIIAIIKSSDTSNKNNVLDHVRLAQLATEEPRNTRSKEYIKLMYFAPEEFPNPGSTIHQYYFLTADVPIKKVIKAMKSMKGYNFPSRKGYVGKTHKPDPDFLDFNGFNRPGLV